MWRILQLADSAFPTGGFAHSAGLEAAMQLGEVRDRAELLAFVEDALWQAGASGLPLVRAALRGEDDLGALDARCDRFLTSHVAHRASRTQGRAFANTFAAAFGIELPAKHLAPVFGAACRALELDAHAADAVWLHLALRGLLSAAVRLGALGPLDAQKIQHDLAPRCAAIAAAPLELAVTAPIPELTQMLHDRLYSRLFQS
jgi:urease accessory protein